MQRTGLRLSIYSTEELNTKIKVMKFFLIACILSIGVAAKAQTFSLKQCVEIAIQNNIEVNQADWQSQANAINYKQTKANQVPFLSSGITHGVNQGRNIDPFTNSYVNQEISFASYGINSNVILWNGGNFKNATSRDALVSEAGKMDLQQAKDNITINVILAYLQVLNNEEQLNLSKQQSIVTREQVQRLNILHKEGAIAPSILYDLRGQLASDELNEINAKNNLETSKLNLTRLMNVDYSSTFQVEKLPADVQLTAYLEQPEVIYGLAEKRLAIIKAADYRINAAEKELAAAKGNRLPSLVLNAGLGTNYSSAASTLNLAGTSDVLTNDYVMISGNKVPVYSPQNSYNSQKISYGSQWKNNFNSGVSIGLNIPIFNGAQARGRIEMAKLSQKRVAFESKTIKTQTKQNVQESHINMMAAYERFLKLQQQVQDFTESFKAAEVRFTAGVGTAVDYIIAKNNLERAKGNFVAAKYDYLLRTKVLDFYQGNALF